MYKLWLHIMWIGYVLNSTLSLYEIINREYWQAAINGAVALMMLYFILEDRS
jgi:hypothetical protein